MVSLRFDSESESRFQSFCHQPHHQRHHHHQHPQQHPQQHPHHRHHRHVNQYEPEVPAELLVSRPGFRACCHLVCLIRYFICKQMQHSMILYNLRIT